MRSIWLRIFAAALFVFLASGTAKYVHEAIEHGGRPQLGSVTAADDDDDDDDDDAPGPHRPDAPPHHPCPVCQLLAVVAIGAAEAPTTLPPALPAVGVRVVPLNRIAPAVRPAFDHPTTGPPPRSA